MKRTASVLLILAGALIPLAPAVYAQDLQRESSTIQRMGAAEKERRERAGQAPTLKEIREAAKTIDEYLQAGYKEHKVRPTGLAGDETFLRRAYLDIAGRIPTAREALDYYNDRRKDKESRLVDQLLESEAYVHNNFNFFADLLRLQTEGASGIYGGIAYADWLKQSLRQNKPYDKMVYELITAEGYPWENGAAGFYLRDDGMPLDHSATTIQIFLGTSLQCAQCHDHPFDEWTQYEFYEMAAFTFGVDTHRATPNVREAFRLTQNDPATRDALGRIARALDYGVFDSDRQIQLPHDYQYSDGKPNEPVKPFPIFGPEVSLGDGRTPRQAYAHWMIDRHNDRFAKTIANRLWKKTFGKGLIEPPDQMTADTQPVNPALMDFLTHKMVAWNYDLKQFQRMLMHTQLYRRLCADRDPPEDQPYYFPAPLLRRMTAEQVWDSLVTITIPEPDFRRGPDSDGDYYRRIDALRNASAEQLLSFAREQAAFEQQRRDLFARINAARERGDEELVARLLQQRDNLRPPDFTGGMAMRDSRDGVRYGQTDRGDRGIPRVDPTLWQGLAPGLVRAAELTSPMRPDHFLRQFGQSDRDLINNASDEPHILQVLAMFNGPYFEQAILPNSELMRAVDDVEAPIDKVRLIFLSVLSREPNQYELDTITNLAWRPGEDPDYPMIIWALLNTREFSFIR